MSVLGWVPDDGYTEATLIAAVPRLYPDLRIEFRPALIAERVDYVKAVEKLRGLDVRKYEAGLMAKKLVSWDLRNAKGDVAPIKLDGLLRLKAKLFDRLVRIVLGEEAGDDDPQRVGDQVDDSEGRELLEAMTSGRSVAEVREEREVKNS